MGVECACFRVWSVKYNSFHDQLVLLGSSDNQVYLHAVPSLSSDPYGYMGGEEDSSRCVLKACCFHVFD